MKVNQNPVIVKTTADGEYHALIQPKTLQKWAEILIAPNNKRG